jgi:hypothetical protein
MFNDNRFALLGEPTPASAQAGSTGGLAADAPAPAPAEQPRRNPYFDFDMSDPGSEVEEGADSEASAEEQVLPVVINLALAAARNIASQPIVDAKAPIQSAQTPAVSNSKTSQKKARRAAREASRRKAMEEADTTMGGIEETDAEPKTAIHKGRTPADPNSKTSQKKARKAVEAARRKAMDEAYTTMGGTEETDDLEEGEIREEAGKEFDTGDNDATDDNWDLY